MRPPDDRKPRNAFIDVLRTTLVLAIVVDHGPGAGWVYASRNVFAVGLWVLYYVTALSGMLFARSRRPFLCTQLRLALIFLLGVLANAAGLAIDGANVLQLLQDGGKTYDLIYQMFFVAGLMIINTFAHVCYLAGSRTSWVPTVVLACSLQCFFGAQTLLGWWNPLDAVRVALFFAALAYTVWCVDNSAPPAHICAAFAAVGALFLVPNFLYGWNDFDDAQPPFRAKAVNATASWVLGYMWGYAQHTLQMDTYAAVLDLYWPFGMIVLVTTALPSRVDLVAPNDPLMRLGVLTSWVLFALLFARLTNLRDNRPDLLGVCKYLNQWSLCMYVTHKLQFGLFADAPELYYNTVYLSFVAVVAAGIAQTRPTDVGPLQTKVPTTEQGGTEAAQV